MKKVIFGFISLMVLATGCAPSNWFLVNSEFDLNYDRIQQKWMITWHTNMRGGRLDSAKTYHVIIADSADIDTTIRRP